MADGTALMAEARKLLSAATGGSGLFGFLTDKESKMTEAAEKFVAAAHAFRIAKKYAEAAQAFEEAAKTHYGGPSKKMLNEPEDMARNYDEASKQWRMANSPEDAKRTMHVATQYWYSKGNVSRSAQALGTLGDWLASQGADVKGALGEFTLAADYYVEDQKPALASKWRLRATEMSVLDGNFAQALEWYQQLADEALQSPTMRFSAKNYDFSACLCSLALGDEVLAKRTLSKAVSHLDFANSPQNHLINDLIEAMFASHDAGEFASMLQQFEEFTRQKFDSYQVAALLAAKRSIGVGEGGAGGEDETEFA